MPYEFVDELTVADIAFRAWGRDLVETFVAAADAVDREDFALRVMRDGRPHSTARRG